MKEKVILEMETEVIGMPEDIHPQVMSSEIEDEKGKTFRDPKAVKKRWKKWEQVLGIGSRKKCNTFIAEDAGRKPMQIEDTFVVEELLSESTHLRGHSTPKKVNLVAKMVI